MPRPAPPRQRIVFCDCFDCSDKAIEPTVLTDEELAVSMRVAQQRPPPKAIMLFGSGLLHSLHGAHSLSECSTPNLDQLTKEGCLNVVALRPVASDGPSAGTDELRQACGLSMDGQAQAKLASSTFASMFQGMQVVGASNDGAARVLLSSLGASLSPDLVLLAPPAPAGDVDSNAAATAQQRPQQHQQQTAEGGTRGKPSPAPSPLLPAPGMYVASMLACLDAGQGSSGPDLLLVHIDRPALAAAALQQETGAAGAAAPDAEEQQQQQQQQHGAACQGLAWLDLVAGELLQRQLVREQVLLCVLLTSQGGVAPAWRAPSSALAQQALSAPAVVQVQAPTLLPQPGGLLDPAALVATPRDAHMLQLSGPSGDALHGLGVLTMAADCASTLFKPPVIPRPMQSWQRRGLAQVEVDTQAPGLCARRLPGVIRRDRTEALSFDEALLRGGLGATLVDHVLPELAYKLGRAPKYGA